MRQQGNWVAIALLSAAMCVGCTAAPPAEYPVGTASAQPPITVAKRDLRPTVSMDAQVVASPEFVVLAPTAGRLSALAAPQTAVAAGAPVATVGDQAVISPADGLVVQGMADEAQTVPQRLPLATIRYTGFALVGTPTAWAAGLLAQPEVAARGQVTGASGPADCVALVTMADPAGAADPAATSTARWLCLLPKDVSGVAAGQAGVVVATGSVASQVVAVPLSAVAGRQGTGRVTQITAEGSRSVEVTLGRTDGSYIEITQGLAVGDQIAALAPGLDTKSPA